ncbi:ATP-dependent DNA helicase srs2, partial [Elasticomyces elasticus]
MTIPSAYDDRWMADGSNNPDAVKTRWNGLNKESQEPDSKRRRFNRDTEKPTTTFMSAASYTMGNPSAASGFSTAREYIATTKPEPTSRKGNESSGPTRKTSGNNNNNNGISQGSISNYFGQPRAKAPQTQPPSNPVSVSQPQPQPRRLPPAQTLQPPRPVLEPSDPNSYTWLVTPSRPMGKSLGRKREGDGRGEGEGKGEGKGEGDSKNDVNEVKNNQNTRPATTFHTTT